MRLPDESISFQNTTGDSGVENLFVYGKLNYNFDNDDIKARSINISGDITGSSFSGSGANLTDIPDSAIAALTASKLTGALPAISGANLTGIEAFVKGMIILWYGNTSNVPSGWVLCDNSTAAQNAGAPDLRDKFVVGAGNNYAVDATGGSSSITLSESQLPSHTHTASVTDPGHQHSTSVTGTNLFPSNGQTSIGYGGAGSYPATTFTMSDATTGISVSNSSTGSGASIENRPPYYALCYIMKT